MLSTEPIAIEASCQRAASVQLLVDAMLVTRQALHLVINITSEDLCDSLATLTRSQSSVPEDVVWGDLEE